MSYSVNLKKIRKGLGLTQSQIAEKMGISETAYGKIERGITTLTIEHMSKISEITGIPLMKLFAGIVGADGDGTMVTADHFQHMVSMKDRIIEELRQEGEEERQKNRELQKRIDKLENDEFVRQELLRLRKDVDSLRQTNLSDKNE